MLEHFGALRRPNRARGRFRLGPVWRPVLGLLCATLLLSACIFGSPLARPTRVATPETIAIVSSALTASDGLTTTVHLANGGEVAIDNRDTLNLGAGFAPGTLLITGTFDGSRWTLNAVADSSGSPSCYLLGIRPFDDGDHVLVPAGSNDNPFGIRLEKASSFASATPNDDGRFGSQERNSFCLNDRGQITGS